MEKNARILITGAGGLIGTNLQHHLAELGYTDVLPLDLAQCDLMDLKGTLDFFKSSAPDYVFHTAAHVFGIMGNMKNKGESFFRNTLINTHVVEACRVAKVKKIVAMGSGCVYPYPSPGLPLREDMIWSGEPHDSEDSYAHAKRAMLAQLNAYRYNYDLAFAFVVSCNLYGPHDKFDVDFGHVVPSLIRKFHQSELSGAPIDIWGNGSARRDFMYVKDVCRALVNIMEGIEGPVNMGSGNVVSIGEIVQHLADLTGLGERIRWDASKPNGQDYREYDLSKLTAIGFKAKYSMAAGLKETYDWYRNNAAGARK